jgi:hypothetical protein
VQDAMKSVFLRVLAALLLLIPVFVEGQLADTLPTPKKWYKQMKLAGIGFSFGESYTLNKTNYWKAFENTASTPYAKEKFAADNKHVSGFKPYYLLPTDDQKNDFVLRFTFKTADTTAGFVPRHSEFSLGVRTGSYNNNYCIAGDSTFNSRMSKSMYIAWYEFQNSVLGLDFLYTLQTPALFNFFSFYTGVGVYGSTSISTNFNSKSSILQTRVIGQPGSDSVYYGGHADFYKPTFNFGWYIPVGLKINVSPRINLFVEYIYCRQTTVFANGYSLANSYKGLDLGIRYKFTGQPSDKKTKKKKGQYVAPQPFY